MLLLLSFYQFIYLNYKLDKIIKYNKYKITTRFE